VFDFGCTVGWKKLQEFPTLAADNLVEFVNPVYTSKSCSLCGCLDVRVKHVSPVIVDAPRKAA
jgi:transposase